jgi:hypothetical protein
MMQGDEYTLSDIHNVTQGEIVCFIVVFGSCSVDIHVRFISHHLVTWFVYIANRLQISWRAALNLSTFAGEPEPTL